MAEKKKLDLALIFGAPKGEGMKERMKEKMGKKYDMSESEGEDTEDTESEDEGEEGTAIKDMWQAIKDDDEEAFASAIKSFKNC